MIRRAFLGLVAGLPLALRAWTVAFEAPSYRTPVVDRWSVEWKFSTFGLPTPEERRA